MTNAQKALNSTDDQPKSGGDDLSASDNRKVVVEDLIFIDDLEIIIYTTVRPKTSNIFITSLQKSQTIIKKSQQKRVIELAKLHGSEADIKRIMEEINKDLDKSKQSSTADEQSKSRYQMIARL